MKNRNQPNNPQPFQPVGPYLLPCPPEPPSDYLEHWIPLTSLERMAETYYDVIIVGSGAGGGAVLWRLCERWRKNGERVALLEAGDLLLQTHAYNLPTFDSARLTKFLANPKIGRPIGAEWPDYPGATEFLALGGKTLHWGAVSPRFHPEDFKYWPIQYKELVPYYLIAERVMNINQGFTAGSSLQEILLDRLRFAGYYDATDFPIAVDREVTKYGEIHSNAFFSSIIFLAYALNLGSFDLAVKARVIQVLVESGKAVGVKVVTPDKKSCFIKGKTVVLSASTFENPRILLNSGIRGEATGRYLINHSFTVTLATASRKQFPEVLGNTGILIPRSEDRSYQLQIAGTDPYKYYWYHYKERPLQEELRFSVLGFGKVEPRVENRVTLDPARRDEYGMPKLNVHFSYSEQDQAIIGQLASSSTYAVSSMGMSIEKIPCLMPPGLDYHEAGTCRMGDDPCTSTTNRFGQVHGLSNLFAADNSVLPFIGAANPTLTTIALAIRTADYIIHRLK
ncbi:GMC oxidoreductase [Effusibacillus consociatus]|uniref:GMC oxidoreductase n=1 Tax=Effusibacillus consociatus TaxID=1117041 RepID=A0ABV9Q4C9_9BACL